MLAQTYKMSVMTGIMALQPIEHRIVELPSPPRRWWQWKTPPKEFAIVSDFMSIGPFSEQGANAALELMEMTAAKASGRL